MYLGSSFSHDGSENIFCWPMILSDYDFSAVPF